MSETPKAKTAKKTASKKAVIADSTNADKPVKAVKKAPVKKTAPKTISGTPKKAPVKKANVKVAGTPEVPAVAWANVANEVKPNKKGFWAKIKSFFTGK